MKGWQNIERQETWCDDYLKWICGFANAQGGELYSGINDSENVVKVKKQENSLKTFPIKL